MHGAAALLLAAALPGVAAQAQTYSGLYSFGGSMSDQGNLWVASLGKTPPSPPYASGRFSNGPVWVEDIAASLGLPVLTARAAGGTNYAFGGAETHGGTSNLDDLPGQLAQFLHDNGGKVPADGLYVLSVGSNDLLNAMQATHSPAMLAQQVAFASSNAISIITRMAGAGARHILVATVADLGRVPQAAALSAQVRAGLTQMARTFDSQVATGLAALAASSGASISIVDVFGIFARIQSAPAAFGFSNVTTACLTPDPANPASGGTPCAATQALQDQYLFWDNLHPTERAHQIIAAQALTQLP
jgi:outer membrane lipase/esterase